jgi:hypothetical protein
MSCDLGAGVNVRFKLKLELKLLIFKNNNAKKLQFSCITFCEDEKKT